MVFVPKNQAGVKVHELHSNYPKLENFFCAKNAVDRIFNSGQFINFGPHYVSAGPAKFISNLVK